MNLNTSITKLLSEIRVIHQNLPNRDKFPVHIEIFSTESSVGLHQYVGSHKSLTLVRYTDQSIGSLFDLELCSLLSNYLRMISR